MTATRRFCWLAAFVLLSISVPTNAAFNAGVAPPRFELTASPGETLREVVTLFNAGEAVESYQLRTADWDIQPDGGVIVYPPELQPGSCRPWTRIERREVTLAPQATKRYRFEVSVPADAPPGECRFALLIETAPPKLPSGGARPGVTLQLPIAARLAVIVYVVVGDARPDLRIEGARMIEQRGRLVPVLQVRNAGAAHGRPSGFFKVEDARGESFDVIVVPSPVLPGRSGEIVLRPDPLIYGDEQPEWQPPLRLRGTLETGNGDQSLDLIAR